MKHIPFYFLLAMRFLTPANAYSVFSFYSGARYWLQQSSDYHDRRALPVRND